VQQVLWVARLVDSISSLEAVYVWARPWGFECWLVANQSTEEERFRLYDLEWDFMEQFPDLGFKFNLIDREGKPLSEVMSVEELLALLDSLRSAGNLPQNARP
jgi:hypothetical protein